MSGATHVGDLDSMLHGHPALPLGVEGWLNAVRARALERANALAVPSLHDEEWRYTDLSPLYKTKFERAGDPGSVNDQAIAPFFIPESGCRLTFIDGHFAARFSSEPRDGAVSLQRLSLAADSAVVREHLTRRAPFERDPFVALNTAWLQDGVVIHVASNEKAATPIHLLFITTGTNVVSYPRVLLVAERGAECLLVEDFAATHASTYLVNAVTEIAVGEAARVQHVRLQRESEAAFHMATCAVGMARDARYLSTSLAFGSRISRYNLTVTQAGEGAESIIDGLALIGGRQLADTHSLLDHTTTNGRSRQLHKCIVDGSARAVFNGKIFVRPGAQRTDSAQQSRSLLLSPRAQVDVKPQLEIFADDVKCAHGAAVGQLEADQLFYLKSRGLDETSARNLLTFAFAAEIIARIPVPSLVGRLEQRVLQQTQNHNRIRP